MSFKPKRILEESKAEPTRPSSKEIAAAIGPLTANLIGTEPSGQSAAASAPIAPLTKATEPTFMMSFKASKSFARTLSEAAASEGGLRRLIARVFSEAGYSVPDIDLRDARKRRRYD